MKHLDFEKEYCLHPAKYVKLKMAFSSPSFPQNNEAGGKAVFFVFSTRWHCCFFNYY